MKRSFALARTLVLSVVVYGACDSSQQMSLDAGTSILIDMTGNSFVDLSQRDQASIDLVSQDLEITDGIVSDMLFSDLGNVHSKWAALGRGPLDDFGRVVAADSSGNIYVTGCFHERMVFGTQTLTAVASMDVFVTKYDSNGNVLWAKSAGGAEYECGIGIAVDTSGNAYVTGGFWGQQVIFDSKTLSSAGMQDVFVAKYDGKTGTVIWANAGGGKNNIGVSSGELGFGIATDTTGNVYVTGIYDGETKFGSETLTGIGMFDIFVVKYDKNGTIKWAKSAGGKDWDSANGIVVDAHGNAYVTGSFADKINFGGTTLTSMGEADLFLTKYEGNTGAVLWAKSAGATKSESAFGITSDSKGDIYVTGEFQESINLGSASLSSSGFYDVFVIKYDNAGTVLWANSVGGSDWDSGNSIAADLSGNVYVTGYFGGKAIFGTTTLWPTGKGDVFVTKYDNAGSVVWADFGGGSQEDFGIGTTVDRFGNVYVSGYFYGQANFGGTNLTSEGESDVFVWKLGAP